MENSMVNSFLVLMHNTQTKIFWLTKKCLNIKISLYSILYICRQKMLDSDVTTAVRMVTVTDLYLYKQSGW